MISVIIPHHLNENQHLLTQAIESVLKQDCPKEILVIADTKEEPVVPEGVQLHWFVNGTVAHFARKINMGVRLSSPESQGYMIFSDDCIMGIDALARLAGTAINNNMMVNALSNCEDINIINPTDIGKDNTFPPLLMPTNRLYMYATMIPKTVWDAVGELDTRFESGWEDEDYSLRASMHSIRLGLLLSAYIYHYKGQTIDKLPRSPTDLNKKRFHEKWGVDFIPPLTMPGFGALLYQGLKQL